MKVCIVSLNALPAISREHQALYAGGAEVQLAQFAMALARHGHDVSLVVGDFGQPDGAVYEGVRTLKTFKAHAGLPGLRFIHPRWTSLWRAISRADADVYYFSCAGMILGLLAMYCKIHKRRLVFRAASDSDCDPRTLLSRYWRDRWLYEYGLRRTNAVLVQSATQQGAMRSNYAIDAVVVRSLIDRPLASPAPTDKDIDVLWVANLRQLKRPDRFIELAETMPQYRFHMAGGPVPGEESYYRAVEERARGVANLTFHGKVPYLEIGRLFDRARVLVNTSEVEGFPNTFLQAWVRGVPVATMFDPDGLVEREALGSSHETVSDLARGVSLLLGSEADYRDAGGRSLAYMEQRYGDEKVLGPYLRALAGESTAAYAYNT